MLRRRRLGLVLQRSLAGVAEDLDLFEQAFTLVGGDGFEDLGLQLDRDGAGFGVNASALGRRGDQPCPPVLGVDLPPHQAVRVHPFNQRRDRIGVASHLGTDLGLADAPAVVFFEPTQYRELVGRDSKRCQTLTKRLV